jgi:hypothetical protein
MEEFRIVLYAFAPLWVPSTIISAVLSIGLLLWW